MNAIQTEPTTIIDKGRGPQLSNSRITVQDVLPYLLDGQTHDDIKRAMPTLSYEEIALLDEYIQNHREEVMEEDRKINERNAEARRQQEIKYGHLYAESRRKFLALKEEYARKRREAESERPAN